MIGKQNSNKTQQYYASNIHAIILKCSSFVTVYLYPFSSTKNYLYGFLAPEPLSFYLFAPGPNNFVIIHTMN